MQLPAENLKADTFRSTRLVCTSHCALTLSDHLLSSSLVCCTPAREQYQMDEGCNKRHHSECQKTHNKHSHGKLVLHCITTNTIKYGLQSFWVPKLTGCCPKCLISLGDSGSLNIAYIIAYDCLCWFLRLSIIYCNRNVCLHKRKQIHKRTASAVKSQSHMKLYCFHSQVGFRIK